MENKESNKGLKLLLEYKLGALETVRNNQKHYLNLLYECQTLSGALNLWDTLKGLHQRNTELTKECQTLKDMIKISEGKMYAG